MKMLSPRNLHLLAHAGFVGLLPILVVGLATRVLLGDQLFMFFQLWALFNVVSLAVFGTVEALTPRVLGSKDGDAGQLALLMLGLPLSIVVTLGYLASQQVAVTIEVVSGMTLLSLSYAAYAAVRGRLIFRGNWSGMARGAFFQLLFTIATLIASVFFLGGRLASIFVALLVGYGAFVFANKTEAIELLKMCSNWRGVRKTIFERTSLSNYDFVGFVSSAVLIGAVPTLPVILANQIQLTVDQLAILAVLTYLVKISVSLSNASTPLVLNLYESSGLQSSAISRIHALVFLVPGLLAVASTSFLSPIILPLYLGFPVEIDFGSAIFLASGELLFALAVVTRTLDIAKGGSLSQILSWGTGGLILIATLVLLSPGPSLLSVSASLFASSLVVILLQWLLAKGKNLVG
jgi:hypothetical protein